MAALTKDVMLKIELANIHAEMVSGNSTKPGDIPALKTPYRKKLTRADMYVYRRQQGRDTTHELERKAFILASLPPLNTHADKLRDQDPGRKIIKNQQKLH